MPHQKAQAQTSTQTLAKASDTHHITQRSAQIQGQNISVKVAEKMSQSSEAVETGTAEHVSDETNLQSCQKQSLETGVGVDGEAKLVM